MQGTQGKPGTDHAASPAKHGATWASHSRERLRSPMEVSRRAQLMVISCCPFVRKEPSLCKLRQRMLVLGRTCRAAGGTEGVM